LSFAGDKRASYSFSEMSDDIFGFILVGCHVIVTTYCDDCNEAIETKFELWYIFVEAQSLDDC